MIDEYTVTITKEHCIDASYMSLTDCPLARAIKEQLPDFRLKEVGGELLDDIYGNIYRFGTEDERDWCWLRMEDILWGKIESFPVTFTKIPTKY